MSLRFHQISFFLLLAPLLLFGGAMASAQGLTLDPITPGFSLITGITTTSVLAIVRFILVVALLISGLVAYRSGYNWIYWEGNAKKALENKTSLSNALLMITGIFLVLVILRVVIGDYSSLVL